MNIEVFLAGFLFLFIIITITISSQLGNKISLSYEVIDPDAKLKGIIDEPKRFRMSVYMALVEHGAIIALAFVMFVAFSSYNLLLGSIWLIARSVEGLIAFNNEKNYWGLLALSKQYSDSSDAEKPSIRNLVSSILGTKEYRFAFAQILFSIGTIGYAVVFAIYGAVPSIIGWFGIVAAALYGLGNCIIIARPKIKIVAALGGLLIFLFEAALGIWLIYASLFIL